MKVKDNNSKSGNPPKTCSFFDEMDEILGDKPYVKPVSIASSSVKRPIEEIKDSESSGEDSDEEKEKEKKNTKPLPKMKKQKKRPK